MSLVMKSGGSVVEMVDIIVTEKLKTNYNLPVNFKSNIKKLLDCDKRK